MISPSAISSLASAAAAPPSPYRTRISVLTLAEDACGAGLIAQNIASALGTVGICTVEQFHKTFEAAGAFLSLEELAVEAKKQVLQQVACILLPNYPPLHGDSAQLYVALLYAMYKYATKLFGEADNVDKFFTMLHKLALANPSVLPEAWARADFGDLAHNPQPQLGCPLCGALFK